jgi:hypothetical protein
MRALMPAWYWRNSLVTGPGTFAPATMSYNACRARCHPAQLLYNYVHARKRLCQQSHLPMFLQATLNGATTMAFGLQGIPMKQGGQRAIVPKTIRRALHIFDASRCLSRPDCLLIPCHQASGSRPRRACRQPCMHSKDQVQCGMSRRKRQQCLQHTFASSHSVNTGPVGRQDRQASGCRSLQATRQRPCKHNLQYTSIA